MSIVEAVVELGAPARFVDGMRSPYTRVLYLDYGGKGDFDAFQDAIAEANSLATVSNPYLLEIITPNLSLIDVGDFTLNAGVFLKGQGRQMSLIRGTPTLRCASRMQDLRWTPTPGSTTVMHFVNDLAGHRAVVQGCYGYLEKNTSGPIYGVKCSGSTTDAVGMEFIGSKLYLANRQETGTAAQMYPFHLETGTNTFIHFDGGVIKTSCGAAGVATAPELIWNQGQGADAYVEITNSIWQAFYSVAPRRLRSENLLHPGADLSMRFRFNGAVPIADIVAMSGAKQADMYDGHFADVKAESLTVNGVSFTPDLPTYAVHNGGLAVGDGLRMLYDEAVSDSPIATGDYGDGREYHAFPGSVRLPSGEMLAVYRSGISHAAIGDKGIIRMQRSTDQGRTWTAPVKIFEDNTYDARDPHISQIDNGDLLVSFFLSSYNIDAGDLENGVRIIRSTDDGATWGAPITVTTPWTNRGSTSDPVLQLANGDLLLGVYGNDVVGAYSAGVVRSTDGGTTWGSVVIVGNIATRDYNESGLVETTPGTVLCMMRNSIGVAIHEYYQSTSTDNGVTWSAPTLLQQRASGTPIMIKLANGKILLVYRRTGAGTSVFGLRVTADGGTTWGTEQLITIPNSGGTDYHAPVELDPGVVALVYAYRNVAETAADVRVAYMLYETASTPNGETARPLVAARTLYHDGTGSAVFQKALAIGGPKVAAGGGDQRVLWLTNGVGPTSEPIGGCVLFSESDVVKVRRPLETAKIVALLDATTDRMVVRKEKTVSTVLYKQVVVGTTSVGGVIPALSNRRGVVISQEDMISDDEAITLKRWSLAHTITTRAAEPDTYGIFRSVNNTTGGLMMLGYSTNVQTGVWIETSLSGTIASGATPPSNAKGALHMDGKYWNGSASAALTGTQRLFSVASNDATVMLLTGDGNLWLHLVGSGLILKSPDGTKRTKFTIDNTGALITTVL